MIPDPSADARNLDLALRQLDIIRNVTLELNKLIGLKAKLDNILQILDEKFNIAYSMILMPDEDQRALTVYASRGYPSADGRVPMGKGIAGMVAEKRIPINITGLGRKRLYFNAMLGNKDSDEISLPGLANAESQIAIPLLSNNELVAVLMAESASPSVFNKEDEKFLLTLTTSIAVSIQNSALFDTMEEKIKTRTAELEQLNQTKDKLFSIISHDLRSPVTSFQSVTQLLKHYASRGETHKIEGLYDKIEQSGNRLNFLLDNLLNWSLSQGSQITCHFETINLVSFFNEITALYCDLFIAKNISLTVAIPSGIAVMADHNTLSVIFRNLLNNALKFTPRNGTVTLSAVQSVDVIEISIEDTGAGMDTETVKKLFTLCDRKSTIGTEKEKGTGLGLLLVHEFVLLNNGKIAVESKPNVGTTFIIELPASSC